MLSSGKIYSLLIGHGTPPFMEAGTAGRKAWNARLSPFASDSDRLRLGILSRHAKTRLMSTFRKPGFLIHSRDVHWQLQERLGNPNQLIHMDLPLYPVGTANPRHGVSDALISVI